QPLPRFWQAWLRRIFEVATVARPWETCRLGLPLGRSGVRTSLTLFGKRGYGDVERGSLANRQTDWTFPDGTTNKGEKRPEAAIPAVRIFVTLCPAGHPTV